MTPGCAFHAARRHLPDIVRGLPQPGWAEAGQGRGPRLPPVSLPRRRFLSQGTVYPSLEVSFHAPRPNGPHPGALRPVPPLG